MRKNRGFTLIELLVVLGISAVVTGIVYSAFIFQAKNYYEEGRLMHVQQDGRFAMNEIVDTVRMAGYGCKDEDITTSGNININGFTKIFTTVDNNATAGCDELTVISAIKKAAQVNGNSTDNIVSINDVLSEGLNNGNKKYIFFENEGDQKYYEILSPGNITSSGNVTINANADVVEEENIYLVKAYTLKVIGNSLKIDENTGGGAQEQELVDGTVENLQFQYGWDSNNNGIIDNSEWIDDPLGNEKKIKAVKIFLFMRTKSPDKDYMDSSTYNIAGENITPNNHYHHYLLKSIVFVRN